MNNIKVLLEALLIEQKKTNDLLVEFINGSKKAQNEAFRMSKEQQQKAFDMVSKANPQMAEMLKGFMSGVN